MASGRSQRRERARRPARPEPPPLPGLAEWTAFGAALLFVASLVVRLLFWHATPGTDWPHNAFFKGDAIVWLQHALAIERDRPFELGLPLRPPGAAWLLALIWDGRRESIDWLRVAWAIQGALAPAVMFVALRRAFSPFVAWVAAALAAVSTGLVLLSSSLGNEAPYLLLVLLTLALFEPVRLRPSVARLGTWSVLHAACCLFRVEHALFYVFCLALLFLSWRGAARGAPGSRTAASLSAAALSVAFFAGPLLPWHLHAWSAVRRFNTVPPPAQGEGPFRQLEASLGPLTWDPAAQARREQLPAFARTSAAAFVAATVVHRGERRIQAADFAILDEAFGYQPRPLPRYPFVAAYGPLNFALANAPGARGGFDKSRMMEPPPLTGGAGRYPPPLVQGLPPQDLALTYPPHLRLFNEGYGVGLRWIAGHPGAFIVLAARKLAIFWEGAALGFTGYNLPLGLSGVRRTVDLVVPEGGAAVLLWRLGILAAAVAGLVAGWRRPGLHPWLAFLASKLIVTVAFFGYARQGALASPVVLLLIALAAERWLLRGPLAGAAGRPHVLAFAILAGGVALEYGRWSDRPQVLIDGQVVGPAADPVPLDVHREHRVEVRPRQGAQTPPPR